MQDFDNIAHIDCSFNLPCKWLMFWMSSSAYDSFGKATAFAIIAC
jgi:hypothetical protein